LVGVQVFGIHLMSPFTFQKLSVWDVGYGLALASVSVMAYKASSVITPLFLHAPADAVNKLWTMISAVFVFRDTRVNSLSAGTSRLLATFVSFLLCLIYLSCFPAHPLGMMAGHPDHDVAGASFRHRFDGNHDRCRHDRCHKQT